MRGGEERARFHVGCAVWSHSGWVGSFYPDGSRTADFLRLYAERLTAVEGNTTFYAVPTPETVVRWAAHAPDSFHFCPKLPRVVTHEGALAPRIADARLFLERTELFGRRLGPHFAQLPSTYGSHHLDDLGRFLQAWPREDAPLCLEVRHGGFYEESVRRELNAMLRRLGVGRVVLDSRPIYARGAPAVHQERRKPNVPLHADVTAGVAFVRFVGHPETERNAPYLDEWAERIGAWLADGTDVYFFAHCPIEDFSPEIARGLHTRLVEAGAPVDALPWDSVRSAQQLDLF
ncbi:MAG: DUF72 domain-containing protein [Planctomycetota bacterium]